MSKKNLARSAIEGGRLGFNKYERRTSHTEERNSEREYCKQALSDPEAIDDLNLIETKSKVYKEFRDKLNPMYRWLRKQVGRRWDNVRSEVFQKFDARTTAGRHILFDHLLRSVETDSTPMRWWRQYHQTDDINTSHFKNDFYVDQEGILRVARYIPRSYSGNEPTNTPWIANWLNGRVVGQVGSKLYWFVPVMTNGWTDELKCQWENWGGLKYLIRGHESVYNPISMKSTYKPVWRELLFFNEKNKKINSRQHLEFSKDDYKIWKEIPAWCHKQILVYSPTK